MSTRQSTTVLRHLRELADEAAVDVLSDTELLQRFSATRDGSAFAGLVRRHGRLVWGLCRRLLHHEQDAEDAFQATFLVLAKKAGSISKGTSAGSFLYGVAYRVALRAKKAARTRQTRERRAAPRSERPVPEPGWRELQALLDEELQALSEKLRAAFVLCCLDGRPRPEVARELGCGEGTLSSRIARAREALQKRLARRGVSLPAALAAGHLWGRGVEAAVPAPLTRAVVRAAAGTPDGVSVAARALAEAVLRSLNGAKWYAAAVLLLGLGLLGLGGWAGGAMPPEAPPQKAAEPVAEVRADWHGDPVPAGALARLGTIRQRAPDSHVAVTADGKEVVTLGYDDLIVRRFDARTGALLSQRRLPRDSSSAVALSPRGRYALTVHHPGVLEGEELELWDLATGTAVRTVRANMRDRKLCITPWAFSADERCLVFADEPDINVRGTFRLFHWDLTAKEPRILAEDRYEDRRHRRLTVALSPDGKKCAACYNRRIHYWDVEADQLLWKSEPTKEGPSHTLFSPDGRTLVYYHVDLPQRSAVLQRRDATTGKPFDEKLKPPTDDHPFGYTPDGRYLVFDRSDSGGVLLWEPGADKPALQLPGPPWCNNHYARAEWGPRSLATSFAFTPDGRALVRRFGALQRWDLATGQAAYPDTQTWGHAERVSHLCFTPDGRRLVSASEEDRTIRVWEVASGRVCHAFPCPFFVRTLMTHLLVTTDSRSLLVIDNYHCDSDFFTMSRWDLATGRDAGAFKPPPGIDFRPEGLDIGQARLSGDGRRLLLLGNTTLEQFDIRDGGKRVCTLLAYEVATGKCLGQRRVPCSAKSLLLPDGTGAIDLQKGGELRLLDTATGQTKIRFEMALPSKGDIDDSYISLSLSPDGRALGVVDFGGFRVWETATGHMVLKIDRYGLGVPVFSPDSRLLAVAAPEGVRLWETATWQELGLIPAHNRDALKKDNPFATALALSPDGRTVARGHADSTILLWDATLRNGARGGALTPAEVEALWADLADTDAKRAYAAVWRLADDPARSVRLLQEQLTPVSPVAAQELHSLLAGLESAQFQARQAAERKLRELGDVAGSGLREALKAKPSAEAQRRIETILAELDKGGPLTGEVLRQVRAVAVLERSGSPEARRLLEALAGGVESARLTRAATEALGRLGTK